MATGATCGCPFGKSGDCMSAMSPNAKIFFSPFTWLNSLTNILSFIANDVAGMPGNADPFTPAAQIKQLLLIILSLFNSTFSPS